MSVRCLIDPAQVASMRRGLEEARDCLRRLNVASRDTRRADEAIADGIEAAQAFEAPGKPLVQVFEEQERRDAQVLALAERIYAGSGLEVRTEDAINWARKFFAGWDRYLEERGS